jgi:hypothetical protein
MPTLLEQFGPPVGRQSNALMESIGFNLKLSLIALKFESIK